MYRVRLDQKACSRQMQGQSVSSFGTLAKEHSRHLLVFSLVTKQPSGYGSGGVLCQQGFAYPAYTVPRTEAAARSRTSSSMEQRWRQQSGCWYMTKGPLRSQALQAMRCAFEERGCRFESAHCAHTARLSSDRRLAGRGYAFVSVRFELTTVGCRLHLGRVAIVVHKRPTVAQPQRPSRHGDARVSCPWADSSS